MTDQTPDGCSGCGGRCNHDTPEECRGPKPIPWLAFDRCMFFYEARIFDAGRDPDRRQLLVRVTYEHCLRLIGRQQGPLLYTTTLLPGETVQLYEFDRYRRVRPEEGRMSVHTSFRQSLSALSQSRRATSTQTYFDTLTDVRARTDASVSAGGGLAGFLGAPQVDVETSVTAETTVASGAAVQTVSDQFSQFATTASQATDAERSLVISSFEDAEHSQTTVRSLRNDNDCYAVTYFVRRVNEVYEAHTRVVAIDWRRDDEPWRSVTDVGDAPDVAKILRRCTCRSLARRSSRRIGRSRCRPTARSTRPSSRIARRASRRARWSTRSSSSRCVCRRAGCAWRSSCSRWSSGADRRSAPRGTQSRSTWARGRWAKRSSRPANTTRYRKQADRGGGVSLRVRRVPSVPGRRGTRRRAWSRMVPEGRAGTAACPRRSSSRCRADGRAGSRCRGRGAGRCRR
jgi:hypothetical protein